MKIIEYYEFSQCICCFRKFTAKQIELSLFVLYGLYLILFIWDFAIFPWKTVRGANAFLFIFSFLLYIYQLSILILIKVFSSKGHLFNDRYNLMKILGFTIYPSILVFFFFILGSLICSFTDFYLMMYGNILDGAMTDAYDYMDNSSAESGFQKDLKNYYQQTFLYIIDVLLCILCALSFFLWVGENTLIRLKDEKSFDYIEKEITEDQNADNQPTSNNQSNNTKIEVKNEVAIIIPGIEVHKRKNGILVGFKEIQTGTETRYEEVLGNNKNKYLVSIYNEFMKYNNE